MGQSIPRNDMKTLDSKEESLIRSRPMPRAETPRALELYRSSSDHTESKESKESKSTKKAIGEPSRGYELDEVAREWRKAVLHLTDFEYKFVLAYTKASSNAEAARMAGSVSKNPERVAWNTLQKPHVQHAIALAMRRRIEAAALDSTEVIDNLRLNHRMALERGDIKAANESVKLMGDYLKMWSSVNPKIPGTQGVIKDKFYPETEGTVEDGDVYRMVRILESAKVRTAPIEDIEYKEVP